MTYDHIFKEYHTIIDAHLSKLLPSNETFPPTIHEAMRYSVLAGGKRFRPNLCLAACRAVGGDINEAVDVACALEYIHTYSLIHDDLPGMDNDDFRRGKPTNHKVFGEAMAILAGDGLLTHAFEVIANYGIRTHQPEKAILIIKELTHAVGTIGMVGGQVVDIQSENQQPSLETMHYIHRHKTGALITASIRVGAIIGGAQSEQLEALTHYGENLGLAFQITDDILDVLGEEDKIGKPVGSDERNQKATFPSLYGIDRSKVMAKEAVEAAIASLSVLEEERANELKVLALGLVDREV